MLMAETPLPEEVILLDTSMESLEDVPNILAL